MMLGKNVTGQSYGQIQVFEHVVHNPATAMPHSACS